MSTRRVVTRTRGVAMIAAFIVISLVACGAATDGRSKRKARGGPMAPTTYDPRLSLAPLVEKVAPAVVNIRAVSRSRGVGPRGMEDLFEYFFGPRMPRRSPTPRGEQRSMGSGFIIDSSGIVVTNNHVVSGADEIEVQLADDRKFKAELLGTDERTDVAVLKLANATKLPKVGWGDSDALRVGDHVIAIGNPFGLDHTVTSGIVSAKARVIGAGPYDDFIQTDASINPGNSGGPLFNLRGEVIGINTAINPQGQGIGFAIPSAMAKEVIESLTSEGTVVRGWLGIGFQALDDNLRQAFGMSANQGVIVTLVNPTSPAAKGGMREGDVITEFNGVGINEAHELPKLVARIKPGQTVPVKVMRNRKILALEIKVGKMPDEGRTLERQGAPKEEGRAETLGFKVDELSDTLRRRLGAEEIRGVVVTWVGPGTPASQSLRPGDVITEVNRDPVANSAAFDKAVSPLKRGDDLLLRVYRGGSWLYTAIRL